MQYLNMKNDVLIERKEVPDRLTNCIMTISLQTISLYLKYWIFHLRQFEWTLQKAQFKSTHKHPYKHPLDYEKGHLGSD